MVYGSSANIRKGKWCGAGLLSESSESDELSDWCHSGDMLGSMRQVMICKGAVMSFHDDVTSLASPSLLRSRSSSKEVSSRDMIVALVALYLHPLHPSSLFYDYCLRNVKLNVFDRCLTV